MNWFFPSSGQSIGASSLASVLSVNIQGWFPLGLTSLISLQSKGLSRVFSSTTVQKHQFLGAQPSLWSNSHIHTWYRENHSFDYIDFCWKLMSLFFNMLFKFDHSFSSKEQASFNFMGEVTIHSDSGAQENKICQCCHSSPPSICYEVLRPDAIILVFLMLNFKAPFSLSSFILLKRLFSFPSLSAIRVASSAYLRFLILLLMI